MNKTGIKLQKVIDKNAKLFNMKLLKRKGYFTVEAAVISKNKKLPLPVYEKVFSAAEKGEKIMSNYMQDDEVGKYKKQTESNISKSNRKSKHKHQYNECLIQYESTFAGKDHISTGLYSYCTRCGKIGDRFKENKSIVNDYLRTIHTSVGKCYSVMSGTELYERYHDKLPVFFVEDIFKDKYINLEN